MSDTTKERDAELRAFGKRNDRMDSPQTASAEVVAPPRQSLQQRPAELSTTNLIDAITRAAKDPSVDVDKMEKLLAMQLRLVAIANEASFNQAMARLKPQLPRIVKNGAIVMPGKDVHIKFLRYPDIHDAVAPLLHAEGFTVSYSSDLIAEQRLLKITATFRHIDGHHDSGSVFLPLTDDTGAKNKVQGVGSVLSYGKRYALCQYLDIVAEDDDDDGMQGAMKPISDRQVSQIVDLITDIKEGGQKFNDEGFLKFMKVERIEDITVRDFDKAISAINQKRGGKK